MTIELPPELIDSILDFLAGDYRALKACSLLCRAWALRSRRHLFKTCTVSSKNVLAFCHALVSGSTFDPEQIRKICAANHDWNQPDPYLNKAVAALRHLTGVRMLELALANVAHRATDAFFRTGFVISFPHVTHLAIACRFPSHPPPLIETICLFPALQELGIHLSGNLPKPPSTAVPPRGLHSLVLGDNSPGPILTWLNAFNHLPAVDSLTLPSLKYDERQIIRTALRRLGRTARHLDIQLYELGGMTYDNAFDLALHPNLITLTIRGHPCAYRDIFTLELITQLDAPMLEQLSLLDLYICPDVDWSQLDTFISPSRFPCLWKVVFRCNPDDGRFLSTALPSLAASGVLALDLSTVFPEARPEIAATVWYDD
ncbi:hypothetical protein C8R45DRAFT_375699 [Mycena sanguinolenta]|nr:hypothetical protein C8R45DRAFT_375699 [Mycena sanguinolenta]